MQFADLRIMHGSYKMVVSCVSQVGVVDKVNEVGEADVVDEVNHLFLHVCDARLHQFHFVLK